MISVLIPVFNTFSIDLVEQLSIQSEQLNVPVEIIVFDDFSDESFREQNRSIKNFPNVIYKEFDKNFGRAQIRKLLAASAKYEWLLFIDGDSKIIHSQYLKCYSEGINKNAQVLSGGRTYSSEPPQECSKKLHWLYGTKRESSAVKWLGKFHSNNFCIKKSIFEKIDFPDRLKGYGYEDSWIGIQLEKLNVRVSFIDNPVLHDGLEDANIILEKSTNALSNLYVLSKVCDQNILQKHVKIYKIFCDVKTFRLQNLFLLLFRSTKDLILLPNLRSAHPSLFIFDMYRLGKFIEIDKRDSSG